MTLRSALIVLICVPRCCLAGGGFTNLYTAGWTISHYPWEVFGLFLGIVIFSVLLEKIFHYFIHHRSSYVRHLYTILSTDVTIVGILALSVLFFSSALLNVLPEHSLLLFEWVHMVLFFFTVFSVGSFLICILLARRGVTQLKTFEQTYDGKLHKTTSVQQRFLALRAVYKHNLAAKTGDKRLNSVPFTKYFEHTVRRIILEFCHVDAKTWVALIVMVLLNAVRNQIQPLHERQTEEDTQELDYVIDVISYVLLDGALPAAIQLIILVYLTQQFRNFMKTNEDVVIADAQKGDYIVTSDSNQQCDSLAFLISGNVSRTLVAMRIPFFLLTFYAAHFSMDGANEAATHAHNWRYVLLPCAAAPYVFSLLVTPPMILMTALIAASAPPFDVNELERQYLKVAAGEATTEDERAEVVAMKLIHGEQEEGLEAPLLWDRRLDDEEDTIGGSSAAVAQLHELRQGIAQRDRRISELEQSLARANL